MEKIPVLLSTNVTVNRSTTRIMFYFQVHLMHLNMGTLVGVT